MVSNSVSCQSIDVDCSVATRAFLGTNLEALLPDCPSIAQVTSITAHQVPLGYPSIWAFMKRKSLVVVFGMSLVFALLAVCASMQVRATPDERARSLAGDELIPKPIGSVNHAITIRRPPRDVWPWLTQMGANRAGWYAYDFIDNGGNASAERILPGYQEIRVGSVFPALASAKDVFVVAQCEPERSLVLSWRLPNGQYQTTWAFVLNQPQPGQTRLIVRGRVAPGYHPFGLPEWFALRVGRVAHFIMERKQLLGIARRAEAS
jgi:hypothetical protein